VRKAYKNMPEWQLLQSEVEKSAGFIGDGNAPPFCGKRLLNGLHKL